MPLGPADVPAEGVFPGVAYPGVGPQSGTMRGDEFLGMASTSPLQYQTVPNQNRENRLPLSDIPPFRPFGEGRIGGGVGVGSTANQGVYSNHAAGLNSPSGLPTTSGYSSSAEPFGSIGPWDDVSQPQSPNGSTQPLPPGAQAWNGAVEGADQEATTNITRFDAANSHTPVMSHLGLQVHHRYIVTQDETGMVIIDQHALHERIMYEQIREKVLQGKLETQQLLVPEPVSLTPAEAAAALDAAEILKQVGIHVEPFGGDTVLITAYPAMLRKEKPAELLVQVLEIWMGAGKRPEPRDLLDHMLHTIACKAAIKAGDRLAPEEITELLQQRHCYQDSHHCPHGRPTALFFSRGQLDKMFKRI